MRSCKKKVLTKPLILIIIWACLATTTRFVNHNLSFRWISGSKESRIWESWSDKKNHRPTPPNYSTNLLRPPPLLTSHALLATPPTPHNAWTTMHDSPPSPPCRVPQTQKSATFFNNTEAVSFMPRLVSAPMRVLVFAYSAHSSACDTRMNSTRVESQCTKSKFTHRMILKTLKT